MLILHFYICCCSLECHTVMADEVTTEQMRTKKDPGGSAPLEIELLLQEGDICWSPPLGTESAGVGSTVLESVEYISNIGAAVERIDSEEGLTQAFNTNWM